MLEGVSHISAGNRAADNSVHIYIYIGGESVKQEYLQWLLLNWMPLTHRLLIEYIVLKPFPIWNTQ